MSASAKTDAAEAAGATGEPSRPRPESTAWRDNLEAMTVAIVMAVMLKYFIVEAYKIPTGSMQPTLFGQAFDENRDGNVDGGVFDRILVDKLSYHFRDPERFDVVVFKYPLDRSKNFVKRLVGMPQEELRIHRGDLWTRGDAETEWEVLRRPGRVMDSVWKRMDLPLDQGLPLWAPADGTAGWRNEGRKLEASGPGTAWFVGHGSGGDIVDTYLHGYPPVIRKKVATSKERLRVGDLRLAGEVRADAGCTGVTIVLDEYPLEHRFVLPGPAAPDGERVHIESSSDRPGLALEPGRVLSEHGPLTAGRAIDFAVQNLDDRLSLWLAGELLCELEVPSVDLNSSDTGSDGPRTALRIELEGGGARFSGLEALRDIYYKPAFDGTSQWTIPAGRYFMLGDNTQDSSDGREWAWYTLSWDGEGSEGEPVRGNRRLPLGRSPRHVPHDANPVDFMGDGGMLTFFRDEWGERYVFPAASKQAVLGASGQRAPLVPRELITGRALLVFWPFKPWAGINRLRLVD